MPMLTKFIFNASAFAIKIFVVKVVAHDSEIINSLLQFAASNLKRPDIHKLLFEVLNV